MKLNEIEVRIKQYCEAKKQNSADYEENFDELFEAWQNHDYERHHECLEKEAEYNRRDCNLLRKFGLWTTKKGGLKSYTQNTILANKSRNKESL